VDIYILDQKLQGSW